MRRLLALLSLFSLVPRASSAVGGRRSKQASPFSSSSSSGGAPRQRSPFSLAGVTSDKQKQIRDGGTAHTAPVPSAGPPSLSLDMSGSREATGSILVLLIGRHLTGRLAVAKLATLLALVYGTVFRFCDNFILKSLCLKEDTKEDNDDFSESCADHAITTNRSLVRRIGRRVLALGVAGYNLFFCGTSAMTAVGTSGTVLLLDRLSRAVEKHKHRRTQQRRHMEQQANNSKKTLSKWELHRLARHRGWERFMDQIKLHLHSVLAWSGVLHPILPTVTRRAVQALGILSIVGTLKDVFFPNLDIVGVDGDLGFLQEQENRSLLLQASGYVMAGLSVFLVTLASSAEGGSLQDSSDGALFNAFGFAWLVNLYSATCFFPRVMAEGEDHRPTAAETSTEDDSQDATTGKVHGGSMVRGLRKSLYVLWLLVNGAIAATLISSPNQRLPATTA